MTPTASKTPPNHLPHPISLPYIGMKNAHIPTKLRKLDSHSQRRRPIAASPITVVCWNTFPAPQFGFNGWISMLKSILGSLCREYHYVFLPWKPSRLQTLRCCGWLGCSTQFLLCLKFYLYIVPSSSLSDSWVSEFLSLRGRRRRRQTRCCRCERGCSVSGPLRRTLRSVSSQLNLSSFNPPRIKHFYLMHGENPAFYPLCVPCAQQDIKTASDTWQKGAIIYPAQRILWFTEAVKGRAPLPACCSLISFLPVWDRSILCFLEFQNGQFSVTQSPAGSPSLH